MVHTHGTQCIIIFSRVNTSKKEEKKKKKERDWNNPCNSSQHHNLILIFTDQYRYTVFTVLKKKKSPGLIAMQLCSHEIQYKIILKQMCTFFFVFFCFCFGLHPSNVFTFVQV